MADNVTPRPWRALVLDDSAAWRRVTSDILRKKGFIADTAENPAEGIARIDSHNYHLLIFDISMKGHGNREWLDLLKTLHNERKTDSSLVVILSHFVTLDSQHEGFFELHAHDVLDKSKFHDETFGNGMRQLVEQKMQSNRSLQISWRHGSREAAEAVVNLKVAGTRVKRGTELHERLQEELEDLFSRLFWRAESILVSRLPAGRSGAGVVKVQPVIRGLAAEAVVVKFGDVDDIATEKQNFDDHVAGILVGNRSTEVRATARTRFLGGIAYSLMGAEEFEPFASFYASASSKEIAEVLNNLFLVTCSPWYTNTKDALVYDLAEEYRTWLRMTPGNLGTAWQELKTVQGGATLKFQSLSTPAAIKNPIPLAENSMSMQTYRCKTHGDLNGGNILVDSERKIWLIDFFKTGEGHVLRDHAFLDVYTRCALLTPDEATLEERLLLEQALLQARKLNAAGVPITVLPSENPALRKAFDTSLHLRSLAVKHGHHRAGADMPDYNVASMYYAMNMIRFYHLAAVQKEHGVLAAGLLAERLGL